jgi:hypothetical protein
VGLKCAANIEIFSGTFYASDRQLFHFIKKFIERASLGQKKQANDIEPIAKECADILKDIDLTIIEMQMNGFFKFLDSKQLRIISNRIHEDNKAVKWDNKKVHSLL